MLVSYEKFSADNTLISNYYTSILGTLMGRNHARTFNLVSSPEKLERLVRGYDWISDNERTKNFV